MGLKYILKPLEGVTGTSSGTSAVIFINFADFLEMNLVLGSTPMDIKMFDPDTDARKLLRLSEAHSENVYLVKLPQWIGETILSSQPGTHIGSSHDIKKCFVTSSSAGHDELRLVVKQNRAKSSHPNEYAISLPSSQHNLRLMETSDSTTIVSKVGSTIHMIPKRDEKYSALLKERSFQADTSKSHRTVENEDEYAMSRTAIKLFQRAEPDFDTSQPLPASSQESVIRSSAKRNRQLDELPHKESRGVVSTSVSLDDALMETLVNNDQGWPLQQLSKALKERGVSAPMNQLKSKLLEICVYQRRGEDTHPKYYLKGEYK